MEFSTERLLIRRFKSTDVEEVFEYLSDPDVMKFIEPPFSFQQTSKFITNYGLSDRPVIFALVERKSDAVIGHIIFREFNYPKQYELGWILNKNYWNLGYATEASRSLLEYAFENLCLSEVVVEVGEKNFKSLNIINKLKMKQHPNKEKDLLVYCLTREEWLSKTKDFIL